MNVAQRMNSINPTLFLNKWLGHYGCYRCMCFVRRTITVTHFAFAPTTHAATPRNWAFHAMPSWFDSSPDKLFLLQEVVVGRVSVGPPLFSFLIEPWDPGSKCPTPYSFCSGSGVRSFIAAGWCTLKIPWFFSLLVKESMVAAVLHELNISSITETSDAHWGRLASRCLNIHPTPLYFRSPL